jgi:hypothetical protein
MEEVRTFRSLDQQNSQAILFIMIELGKKGVSLLTAKRLSKGSLHLESEATKSPPEVDKYYTLIAYFLIGKYISLFSSLSVFKDA